MNKRHGHVTDKKLGWGDLYDLIKEPSKKWHNILLGLSLDL
jgi:hypothetical protein